jgi:acyl dehydratase
MAAFARVSGDRNAIHLDDAHAVSRGFDGAVVYGGLLLAKVSRLVGMELPTDCLWNGVRLDFRRPLYVNQSARLEAVVSHVAESVRAATIKVKILSDDRVLASGSVDVTYHHD